MGLKSRDPQKTHLWNLPNVHLSNFNFLVQFGGKIGEEQHFFEVKKEENLYISPLNCLGRGVDFLILYTTFDLLSAGLKKQILRIGPLSTPSP